MVFGYCWCTLLWYWCYYPHRSRDALSPVCGIFFLRRGASWWRVCYQQGPLRLACTKKQAQTRAGRNYINYMFAKNYNKSATVKVI